MVRRPKADKKILTDAELELMNIIWTLGEANVSQVLEALPPERKLAYTSVSTILRILEQKQVLASRKEGRGHIYYPLVTKEDYQQVSVEHLVDHVFAGAPSALVRRLLDSDELSYKDLQAIKRLLEEKLR